MLHDDDRASTMLTSRDERISGYLRTTRSTDDIVRDVTRAFASDVARIMADVDIRSRSARADVTVAETTPSRTRRR
jgi:hypothetical protein